MVLGVPTQVTKPEPLSWPFMQGVACPEQFGCKGQYEARSQGIWDGTHFSDTYFKFKPEHVGWSFYQDGSTKRTIVSVTADGKAVISPGGYGSNNINWRIVGQDDTPYFQAFLDALSPDYPDAAADGYPEPAIGLNGATRMGKIGVLTPGARYPVFLSQAEQSGGKRSALIIRRRTSLTTAFANGSAHGAIIVQIPQSRGYVISNRDTSAYTDFVTLSCFTINADGDFSPNSTNAFHWETPYGNYDKIDPYPRFEKITVERANGLGFFFYGKGEVKTRDLDAFNCKEGGILYKGQYDLSAIGGQYGGNGKCGFRVDGPGPFQATGIKSFYSGSNGGSNDEDCANIVFEGTNGDVFVGGAFISNVQSQESRGCGIVIKIRGCVTSNLQVQDPNRQTIGSGTRPTVKAGIYLKGPYACDNYIDAIVGPALTAYATPNWPADTYILYIDGDNPFQNANGGPQNNEGNIKFAVDSILPGGTTFKGVTFNGSASGPTAGGGCVNGKNTKLMLNGVALT